MIPLPWIKAAPWLIAALMAFVAFGASYLYMDERDQFLIYRTSVKTLGEAAEKDNARLKALHADNLKKVKADHEAQLPEIRALAVRNYLGRVRHANPGGGPVPSPSERIKVDDGASPECVADTAFIRDSGEDAAKLAAWHAWCALNQCPVEH